MDERKGLSAIEYSSKKLIRLNQVVACVELPDAFINASGAFFCRNMWSVDR